MLGGIGIVVGPDPLIPEYVIVMLKYVPVLLRKTQYAFESTAACAEIVIAVIADVVMLKCVPYALALGLIDVPDETFE